MTPPQLPASLLTNPWVSTWLTVADNGVIALRVGKVELGQGILTAWDVGHESAAAVNAHARPLVSQQDPSVAALTEGRPNDNVEDEQAVAARQACSAQSSRPRWSSSARSRTPISGRCRTSFSAYSICSAVSCLLQSVYWFDLSRSTSSKAFTSFA